MTRYVYIFDPLFVSTLTSQAYTMNKQVIFLPTITLFQVSTRFQVSPSLEITVDRVFLYGTPLGRASLFRISLLDIPLEPSRWKRRDDRKKE